MKQNDPLRVYISGPISEDPQRAREEFSKTEVLLRSIGFEVVNPVSLIGELALSWTDCMRIDLKAMMACDALYSLPGWEHSRGSRLERMIAGELAFLIFDGAEHAELWMRRKRERAA